MELKERILENIDSEYSMIIKDYSVDIIFNYFNRKQCEMLINNELVKLH